LAEVEFFSQKRRVMEIFYIMIVVYIGVEPSRVKPKTIKFVFVASLPSIQN